MLHVRARTVCPLVRVMPAWIPAVLAGFALLGACGGGAATPPPSGPGLSGDAGGVTDARGGGWGVGRAPSPGIDASPSGGSDAPVAPGAPTDAGAGSNDGPQSAPDGDAGDTSVSADGAAASPCETTCKNLEEEYLKAVQRDMVCSPALSGQCAQSVASSLPCGCPVTVNNTTATAAVRKMYDDAGCSACKSDSLCLRRACPVPPAATCQSPLLETAAATLPSNEVITPPIVIRQGTCQTGGGGPAL